MIFLLDLKIQMIYNYFFPKKIFKETETHKIKLQSFIIQVLF